MDGTVSDVQCLAISFFIYFSFLLTQNIKSLSSFSAHQATAFWMPSHRKISILPLIHLYGKGHLFRTFLICVMLLAPFSAPPHQDQDCHCCQLTPQQSVSHALASLRWAVAHVLLLDICCLLHTPELINTWCCAQSMVCGK